MRRSVAVCLLAASMSAILSVASANARQDVGSTLPPAAAGLLPVPLPSLDRNMEAAVVQQIEAALRNFRTMAATKAGDRGALADEYGNLGQLYHAYEIFDAAEACYENARRLAPRNFRWPHLLAYLRQQTGSFDGAASLYIEALRLEPDDYAAEVHLGEIYLQLDRPGDARRQFDTGRSRFPLSAMAGLGEIALRERRFDDAIRLLEEVLRRAPHATRLHYSIGMAYRGLGRMEAAESHLKQAGRGRVRAADPLLDGLPTLVQGVRALINQGRTELEVGAYASAAAAFRRALAAAPDSLEARTALAGTLERLGDRDGALDQLAEAARLLPANPDAHRQLARALVIRGRADAAIDTLKTVVSLDSEDEDSLLELAILLADEQRFREALVLLDGAFTRASQRDRTATTLARLLAASPDVSLRNGARALDIAMQIYSRAPTPVHAETVALSLAELGRCVEARDWMRRAVAEAERNEEATEIERLTAELPKYVTPSCAPGR